MVFEYKNHLKYTVSVDLYIHQLLKRLPFLYYLGSFVKNNYLYMNGYISGLFSVPLILFFYSFIVSF